MAPDNLQQAWQSQTSLTRITIDADLLLKEVQRSQRRFRAMIFWRDFREVGVALLMIPLWFYLGAAMSLPWTWYLTVPAMVWGAGFILVDRMRHQQQPSEPGEPLLQSVQVSLTQVVHQIWLLRNIFWWYLLPFTISILAFFAHVAWLSAIESNNWLAALGFATFLSVFLLALYYWIYRLNQRAVRTHLEPRRQELLALLASLRDETTSEVSGEYPILMSREGVKCSPRRMFVASLCFVAILLIGVPGILFIASSLDQGYPKKSPFAAVQWQQSQPEVKIDDEWFKLVSLDGIAAGDIVAFSQQTYGNLWRKRFEEDLVELLTRMGHPPQDTVTLVVQSLTSPEPRTLEDVPMTRANRRAIRDAAQAREHSEQPQGMRRAVPIDDAALFRTRIDEFLNAARTKDGFSGAVVMARGGQLVYEGAQFAESPYRNINLLTHMSGLPRIVKGLIGPLRWNAMSKAATPVDDYVRLLLLALPPANLRIAILPRHGRVWGSSPSGHASVSCRRLVWACANR